MAAKYNVFSVAVNTYEMPVNSELGLQWFSSSRGEMRPAFEFGIGGRGVSEKKKKKALKAANNDKKNKPYIDV